MPQAARRDARLYELLALVDAIRAGVGKAHDVAVRELRARLGVDGEQARDGAPRRRRSNGVNEATMARKAADYTAEDIEILEDLSPILHRPGMYTDPVNPNHALVEIIDNAADEGLAGFASNVAVTLFEDGSAEVIDDGRGIPVDIHPKKKVPAVQVIFTTLHSGGKFRKTDKDAAYRIAGGLHGVGICVPQRAVQAPRGRSQARRRAVPDRVRGQRQGQGAAQEDSAVPAPRTPARACASGRTRSTSIRPRSSPPTSPRCCGPRRCSCPA